MREKVRRCKEAARPGDQEHPEDQWLIQVSLPQVRWREARSESRGSSKQRLPPQMAPIAQQPPWPRLWMQGNTGGGRQLSPSGCAAQRQAQPNLLHSCSWGNCLEIPPAGAGQAARSEQLQAKRQESKRGEYSRPL